jgi:hypothetical protein
VDEVLCRCGPMMMFERLLRRAIAVVLVLLLGLPLVPSAAQAQESTSAQQQNSPAQQQDAPVQQQGTPSVPPPLPSPARQNQNAPITTAPAPSNMQPPPAPQAAQPAQAAPPVPVGTAAAPYEKGIGVAASRPAGVVIAPAKQRRSRSFLIKTGLLIGAAVAVGTVVALSSASPSEPH